MKKSIKFKCKGEEFHMKKSMKIITYIAVVSMLITLFSGCARNNQPGPNQSPGTTPGASPNTEGKTAFRLVTVRWTDAWPNDFMKQGFMKQLEDAHKVNINWDVYYYSDWSEQKSLMLAGRDLPDGFFGSISLTDTDVAQNLGSFIALDDLIAANMPNLTAIMDKDPSMRALVTSRDDGKIYSLPKRLPLRPTVADAMYINKKWLDELNLKVPTTYKELENVLKAFKDKNRIPYSDTATANGDMRHLMIPFGTQVSRALNYMGLIDGKPVFMPTTENFKKGTMWIHDLYKKGLLDPERFTQDKSMYDAKSKAEGGSKIGLVFGWTADAEVGPNAADFELVEAVAGPDGKRYIESDPTYLDTSNNELIITTTCQNPELLLKWADSFYTDEASLQTFYGSIPEFVKKNDDGTYSVLEPPGDESLDTSAWSNSFRDFGPKYMDKEFEKLVKLPPNTGDGIKLAQDKVNAKYAKETFPKVTYTNEQSIELANLSTDLYNYVESTYAHWIVDGGIEKEWDGYLKQLDAMGLPRLMEIQMDAYNAYKEATKK